MIQTHTVPESFPTKGPNVFGFCHSTIRELGRRRRTTSFEPNSSCCSPGTCQCPFPFPCPLGPHGSLSLQSCFPASQPIGLFLPGVGLCISCTEILLCPVLDTVQVPLSSSTAPLIHQPLLPVISPTTS